ncbi:MAG: hypothetical protein EAZ97_04380 [Bacteroidetes bacterium]|nr:MAG: hypothetical protein EAZ97_04380 [Bacteroidota bacterium]
MKQLIFFFIILLFCTRLFAQEIGFPFIRNYTPKEYGNEPQVFSAVQDNRGIMYFGVGNGVIEYDGVSWLYIPNEKQASVYGLVTDTKGKVYVTAIDEFGYLTTNEKGSTIYKSLINLTDTMSKLGIVKWVHSTSKHLYFQTYDAILQYTESPEKLSIFKADTGRFLGDFVYQDTYYAQLYEKGLMKIENNELKYVQKSDFFKNKNRFNSALSYNKNTFLIPTRTEGLYLYKPDTDSIPKKFNLSNKDFTIDNNIYSGSVFQKEYFVLGSLKQGALLIDKQGQTLQKYNENNLLQNNNVWEVATDNNENIWLGLNNGISKTEHSQDLSYWNQYAGLKDMVEDVIRYDGIIYIATHQKIYFIDKNNQIQEFKNIQAGQGWCFLEDKKRKSLLVGTSHGIYEIKADKAKQIYKGGHATKLYQSSINSDRIFSTDEDLLISLIYVNDKWITEYKWEEVKDDILGIIEGDKGEIWIGTSNNGVIRVTTKITDDKKINEVRYYKEKDGFASLKNISPFKFKNKIIFGTSKGLYIYNSKTDRFDSFCEFGEIFCDGSHSIASLIEMPDGKIWIFPTDNKNGAIGYLQPDNKGKYDWIYLPFRRIPDMFLAAYYIEPSGIAWIGGSEGLYRYDLTKDTKNYQQKFNCLIRKIIVEEDNLVYGGNIPKISNFESFSSLEYKDHNLIFQFAAPFFDHEERTLYSYQLENFDPNWSEWSLHTEKEYTNLSEGTYIFKVKAKNIYDLESEIASYKIQILPPFYRTWWAYLLYAICSALAIYGIVKWNTRRLQNDKIKLEKIIKERTAEITEKNAELEQQQEEIKQTLDIISEQKHLIEKKSEDVFASINYAKRIQNAILPFEERMARNLGKGNFFVFYKPKDIVSGDFYWFEEIQRQTKTITFIAVADCTGHGVPGAFMSMIGNQLLHEIIIKNQVYSPDIILRDLHKEVQRVLRQKETNTNDGMDIAILGIERNTISVENGISKIEYAGAMNPLYLVQNQEFTEIKATKRSIGGKQTEEERTFEKHLVWGEGQEVREEGMKSSNPSTLSSHTTIYLCSDGYQDQFGGKQKRKFMVGTLKKLLFSISEKQMAEQKQILSETFEEKQIDDITILGIRI